MLATIWMCTHEWSLIWSRTTALTFETCHQAFSSRSSFARSSDAAELAVAAVGQPDPHVLDRLGRREPGLADRVGGDRLLDARFGLGVEVHASTGAATSLWVSRSRKYMTAIAIAPKGATTAWAIVEPTRISKNSGEPRERGLEERARDAREERGDDHDPEDRPAVAAHELARPTERLEDAGLLDDDHGRDHGPDRDQEETGDDQEQEPERDPEAGEQAGERAAGRSRARRARRSRRSTRRRCRRERPGRRRRTRPGATSRR